MYDQQLFLLEPFFSVEVTYYSFVFDFKNFFFLLGITLSDHHNNPGLVPAFSLIYTTRFVLLKIALFRRNECTKGEGYVNCFVVLLWKDRGARGEGEMLGRARIRVANKT